MLQLRVCRNDMTRWELNNAIALVGARGEMDLDRKSKASVFGVDGLYAICHGAYPYRLKTPSSLPKTMEELDNFPFG